MTSGGPTTPVREIMQTRVPPRPGVIQEARRSHSIRNTVYRLINHPEFGEVGAARKFDTFPWYRSSEHIRCNRWDGDDTVSIENGRVDSIQAGTLIESQNATVLQWTMEVIEQYYRQI